MHGEGERPAGNDGGAIKHIVLSEDADYTPTSKICFIVAAGLPRDRSARSREEWLDRAIGFGDAVVDLVYLIRESTDRFEICALS
ncbi:hypothetical protein IHE45_18G032900 [Dioscorea alata]|uniref:Uncharacterized protein n=1 Tax=Dioscorea alata TaxID=55571 RepID=A0ACB7U618_DIOAL|nr:hypothetical protein IHE45_18G032900 [Dioscorea alata]